MLSVVRAAPSSPTISRVRVLARLLAPYWFLALAAFFLMTFHSLVRLLSPIAMKGIFDDVLGEGHYRRLLLYAPLLCLLPPAAFLLNTVTAFVYASLANRFSFRLSLRVFRSVLLGQADGPVTVAAGGVLNRLLGDVEAISGFLTSQMATTGTALLSFLVFSAYLVFLNPLLYLLSLAAAPSLMLVTYHFTKKIVLTSSRSRALGDQFLDVTQFALNNLFFIRTRGIGRREQRRFGRTVRERADAYVSSQTVQGLYSGYSTFLLLGSATLVVLFGVFLISQGHLTPGGLVAFITSQQTIVTPGMSVLASYTAFSSVCVSLDRLQPYLGPAPGLQGSGGQEDGGARSAHAFQRDLRFVDVAFAYHPDHPILQGLNLTVRKGDIVGVFGKSGSGKSTIIKMLVGTIQPAKGAIEIDGIPLPEIPQNRRRHIFAILPQSIAIFHDTLRSNLLLGIARPATVPVSDDEILRVLDSVGLPGFVEDLPNRLDNVLRDEYSAGQAQRVVLASTLLKDSDIYVFDEPTSALDSENVGLVRDSLTTLRQRGKTILLFTHETRLADICDQVHFLAGGALRSSEDPGPLVGEEQSPCGGRAHAPNCADATIQRHS